MSLGVSGAAIPPLEGSGALQRWMEWICSPSYHQAAQDTAWTGFGYSRSLPMSWNAGNPQAVFQSRGNQGAMFRVVNDEHVLDVFAIAGVVGAQECAHLFRPSQTASFGVEFTHAVHTILEAAPAVQPSLAVSIMAWIRKRVAGDATSSAQFVGLVNDNGDQNFSRRVARVGVMGDGALGFRFGSVNCPNAPAGGADNLAGDVDAGSVQPGVLVNPGANWWHVRIKMVPATQQQTGRVGCYLNGRLVATFAAAANMPRTSRSNIDVSGAAYWPLIPGFMAWGNGGAAPSPGYYLRDLRVRMEEDLTL